MQCNALSITCQKKVIHIHGVSIGSLDLTLGGTLRHSNMYVTVIFMFPPKQQHERQVYVFITVAAV